MKKITVLFIFAVLVLALLGCTNNNLPSSTQVMISDFYPSYSSVTVDVLNYGECGIWKAIVYDDEVIYDSTEDLYLNKSEKERVTLNRPPEECTLKVFSRQDSGWVETDASDVEYVSEIVVVIIPPK